ncbi:hypothetical protein PHYBOEH_002384 [Phytophthora boehmeriae]|uniref:Uncharacterized protein n=1 Tax=Phytophthora boehmeriae TaxID=109152 RepID=A0A8T1XCT3_9STRA|nr:hypothetical protein PHYBOEH_002384 [Phytophthora boehmeriae]
MSEVEKANKQIQTQEQDDQWEWQRVWKGAFAKMRQQLQDKTDEADALIIDNKELRALLTAHKKALEDAERDRRDVETKHAAELDNLRAVHALELADLQARHRQKLQEMALQNDEQLLGRRRENRYLQSKLKCVEPHRKDSTADANSDFLQYIDDFYSATLQLTSQNKL